MERTFYIPLLLVIVVDWLLLHGTDMLFGSKHSWLAMGTGAIVGGIHAAICLMPGFEFLNAGVWRLIILAVAGCIAFDMDIHRTALYCLINMGIGGLIYRLGEGNISDTIFAVLLVCALCFIGLRGKPIQTGLIPIKVNTPNGTINMNALMDTGNMLCDPVTGREVMVVSARIGSRLLGVDESIFKNPTEALNKVPGLRLIPYNTIAGKGLMLAKRYKQVLVGKKTQDILIGFSPLEIGKGKGFDALKGGTCL